MKTFYVSSYGKSDNKGIYIIDLNEENQKLSLVQHIVTHDYPSYMITKNNILYVAYKNASRLNNGGGIGSFSIHKEELIPNNNILLMDVLIPIYVLVIIHDIFLQLTIMLVPQHHIY